MSSLRFLLDRATMNHFQNLIKRSYQANKKNTRKIIYNNSDLNKKKIQKWKKKNKFINYFQLMDI